MTSNPNTWTDVQSAVSAEGCPEFDTWISKLEWLALAWAGEVGEVCNVIKKIRRDDEHGTPSLERMHKLRAEIVDSVVYLLVMLDHLGVKADSLPAEILLAHEAFLGRKSAK